MTVGSGVDFLSFVSDDGRQAFCEAGSSQLFCTPLANAGFAPEHNLKGECSIFTPSRMSHR